MQPIRLADTGRYSSKVRKYKALNPIAQPPQTPNCEYQERLEALGPQKAQSRGPSKGLRRTPKLRQGTQQALSECCFRFGIYV